MRGPPCSIQNVMSSPFLSDFKACLASHQSETGMTDQPNLQGTKLGTESPMSGKACGAKYRRATPVQFKAHGPATPQLRFHIGVQTFSDVQQKVPE
ncbi:hypothetical protein HO173_011830 [Letharia columbiana]|uniref:Uncharacterized protein n=1 Tax=Letharia columbiana TaxID=112416 RepID=A0A8H6CS06_9LECA|nr:uncharacterized protein HO173_011830 [Letharia columbiana]KAF6228595.1 hypothetical protein HO173_011830 [Letharia columbiana]